ncbi:hypothetical protein PC129_g13027 [Phytophthora cactorum]|uniref:Uncharacterized protein n=1 Tax=Phytophthora cactorum TaxID=29920 RepID=A0A8T1HTC4_9STRA|nr:hypothetical protein PC114_g15630 [Phytophthora cactorum]KAG2908363.1 hypothetical protein PC115_g13611 [Phytophthora cactorum]KAG2944807.1 hypothetical protein PC117_g8880 [Phytophthora cactorum]KAG3216114.1 hypothetical protein PC129_g13027 [Phytophthora cactorum]KAG4246664.1 hypothetical protein PC116_g5510 [Phytophthora cactorum]
MATFEACAVMPVAADVLQKKGKPQTTTADVEEELLRRERRRRQCRPARARAAPAGHARATGDQDVEYPLGPRGAVVKAVEQYYTVFSHGMHNPEAGGDHVRKCFNMQVGFVKAFMDKDVEFGDSRGISVVLNQWHLYTLFHATLSVRMLSAEVCGTEDVPIVVVKGVLAVRMNRSSIENMFPHIVANEELVQVLLGREIEYPTSTTYVFNSCSQVERQDIDVDFLAGINRCLGSTYASSRVMQRALISDCCKLGQVSSVTTPGLVCLT